LGDTRSALAANVVRLAGVIGVFVAAMRGVSIEGLVVIGIASELGAIAVTVAWLKTRNGIVPGFFDVPFAITAACLCLFGWLGTCEQVVANVWVAAGVCLGAWVSIVVVFLACFVDLRFEFFHSINSVGQRLRGRLA
jgi:hypothetical protein